MNRSAARKIMLVADRRTLAAGRHDGGVRRFRLVRLPVDPAAAPDPSPSVLKHD